MDLSVRIVGDADFLPGGEYLRAEVAVRSCGKEAHAVRLISVQELETASIFDVLWHYTKQTIERELRKARAESAAD